MYFHLSLSNKKFKIFFRMGDHEYKSIEMMQGSMSQQSVAEPAAFERANYMRVLGSYTH